ncbi:hypothetical protein H261_13793 [Paramagnetospirillum caucaseum]|uniref:Uncharacterized protein n=1 Tax=Paramagnetospirillum caucaseum TaxID=1244869 RepID=M3A9A5_9PROT|nr:hypothetical protein [Paramagnetospirillum caucaseum]EME69368.1 hypothetical protein H261_13793 [Paramagnetospirillum caucaseum]
MAESRIASVEGFQFSFHTQDPETPIRKVQDRWVKQDWACQVEYEGEWCLFTIHEFNDGVFEPSAVQGVFSDFAGAAAVEVTTRWLQRRLDEKDRAKRRQRDIFLGALAVVAALALAAISLR